MTYFLHSDQDEQAMLQAIGASNIEELLQQVPADLQLDGPLDLPRALTEIELNTHMRTLAGRNVSTSQSACFLGGGAYDHFIPSVIDHLASRGEYYTSYTPYQAEASQGNLQVFFEYQTMITRLTGMEVSNASLYEGGTAAMEAVFMSISATKRRGRVVVLESVHPEYRQILQTYLLNLGVELVTVPTPNGVCTPDELAAYVDDQTACVLVQHPNFFGNLESVEAFADVIHDKGAQFVVSVDPISLGLLKRPGDYGADVVVAEGQSLGNPLYYGGPYLGIMACRENMLRRMPGRLVGETVDRCGNRCWVLTMQTREQHIRRDKATSNICTNQGLFALRATIYLSLLGPQGLKEVANLSLQKAHYAVERFTQTGRLSPAFDQPFFKEFVVRVPNGRTEALLHELQAVGIQGGIALGKWYPQFTDCLLVSVTEKRSRAEIDHYAQCLENSSCFQDMTTASAS